MIYAWVRLVSVIVLGNWDENKSAGVQVDSGEEKVSVWKDLDKPNESFEVTHDVPQEIHRVWHYGRMRQQGLIIA